MTSDRYFGVQFYLEDLFGRQVDLATEKALRPELRPYVERQGIGWTPSVPVQAFGRPQVTLVLTAVRHTVAARRPF